MRIFWGRGAAARMSLFSTRCTRCGALIELPGRIGFKIKGGGDAAVVCRNCRRSDWLNRRQGRQGTWSQRTIPLIAIGLGVLLASGGVWLSRISGSQRQESLPAVESLSR